MTLRIMKLSPSSLYLTPNKIKLSIIPLLFITAATTTVKIRAMSTTPTTATTTTTTKTHKPAALIFLHGLGDTPAGWSSLQHQLPSIEPSLQNIKYVFPPAPTIPISINGGMKMPGWFDLDYWPIGIEGKDDDIGLSKAVEVVEQCVEDIEKKEGITRDRIVIGGFSQGGAVALRAAYHGKSGRQQEEEGTYAACISLSGWVTFDNIPSEQKEIVKHIPLFLGHGSFDDKVLFEQQNHAEITLTGEGVNDIESRSYDMGHSSHPQEMVDMAKFLKKILFDET